MRALLNVVDLLDQMSAELGDKGDMRRTSRFTKPEPCRRIGPGRRVQLWALELSSGSPAIGAPWATKGKPGPSVAEFGFDLSASWNLLAPGRPHARFPRKAGKRRTAGGELCVASERVSPTPLGGGCYCSPGERGGEARPGCRYDGGYVPPRCCPGRAVRLGLASTSDLTLPSVR
jgi:hypothetical protein